MPRKSLFVVDACDFKRTWCADARSMHQLQLMLTSQVFQVRFAVTSASNVSLLGEFQNFPNFKDLAAIHKVRKPNLHCTLL